MRLLLVIAAITASSALAAPAPSTATLADADLKRCNRYVRA